MSSPASSTTRASEADPAHSATAADGTIRQHPHPDPAPQDGAASEASTATAPTGAGTAAAHPRSSVPHRVGGPRRWWDWVIAADPGLGHLQAGWRSLIGMVVSLAVGYGMAHALDVPAMLGMMVGGMLGLMSSFAVAENTAGRLAKAILWMPVPYSAVLSLGAWMSQHGWRVAELVCISAALALTFLMVRLGPLGLLTGMMFFNGLMVNTIAPMPLDQCGRLFVIAVVTSVAILAARLVFCYPMPHEDLLRTQRAFVVEARRVLDSAATALDPDAHQAVAIKRMRRALRRLNVTTLTIDGRLAMPEVAADPVAAELLHQYLFDAELALSGIGKAIQDMAGRHVPSELRETLVVGLVLTRDTHLGRVGALHPAAEMIRRQADNAPQGIGGGEEQVRALARRIADLLDSLATSLAYWLDLGWSTPRSGAEVPFQPTVALERGVPAGSGPAAQKLVDQKGGSGWRRLVPVLRAPLQLAVGAAIVVPCADAINGHRYYWGLIGLMIVSFGTNTTHERWRKFAHRMVGTVVGALIGIPLVHLVDHVGGGAHVYWMLAVMVAGLTFGAWGMQRQYAYWVIGLVVALCQMYATETPLNQMDWLLTERLFENGLGFAVGILVGILIFPVSTRKVAREAERGYLSAVGTLVRQVGQRWQDPAEPIRLRAAARGVDAALFQVQSVARPLVRMPMGVRGRRSDNLLALLGTATRHANALASSADLDLDLAPELRARTQRITEVFSDSLEALDRSVATGQRGGTWTRVSPMVVDLEAALRAPSDPRSDRLSRALRELAALDEVLAGVADSHGLRTASVEATPDTPRLAPRPAEPIPRTVRMATGATAATAATAIPDAADAADGAVRTGAAGRPTATQLRAVRNAWARSGGASAKEARAALTGAPERPAATAPAPAPAGVPRQRQAVGGTAGATVCGAIRCAEHPGGCDAWITVVTDRGKRRALVKATGGRYQVTGLTPGGYTLIASSASHPPVAEFLLVDNSSTTHDIEL